ncbi:unnamed protein product [Ilex paraguariensis]|uniref:DNA-directed RNA polymerase RBP11-like dimerisation domain-containing protein n=1 Tax=Ilex paraguariensis TaxID=185542 RepID=A0ABC8S742_9AQUA
MNAPNHYKRFVIPESTKKVPYERDTKMINTGSFTIEKEDHTIGNKVRMQLHRDENVLFTEIKNSYLVAAKTGERFAVPSSIYVDKNGEFNVDAESCMLRCEDWRRSWLEDLVFSIHSHQRLRKSVELENTWIQLIGIPSHLWCNEFFIAIGNYVGVFVRIDSTIVLDKKS